MRFNLFKPRSSLAKYKLVIIAILILAAFSLRVYKYMYTPWATHGEELLFVWSGYSLITEKVPISWSNLDAYQPKHVYFDGLIGDPALHNTFGTKLFKPWLDEPPLFSLIVGLPQVVLGVGSLNDIPPAAVFRLPMLLISFFILIFIYKLTNYLFGFKPAFWAVFIYGFSPLIIISNRLAVPENLITLLFLILAYLTLKLKSQPKKLLIHTVIISLIAGLSKPTGLFISLLPAVYLWKDKKYKLSFLTLIIPQLLFWAFFLAYGYHYDWPLFVGLLKQQGLRPAGFTSLAFLLSSPAYDIALLLDNWYYIHLLSLFALVVYWRFTKNPKMEFVLWGGFIWLFIFVLSSGQTDLLPWYRYPLFAFTSIAFGVLFTQLLKKGFDLFSYSSLILLSLGNLALLDSPFPPPAGYRMASSTFRFLLILLLLPAILSAFKIRTKLTQKITTWLAIIVLLIGGLFVNSWYIYRAYGLKCDHIPTCNIPNMTGKQLLKQVLNKVHKT
ncbi:MAG: hypothetical protein GXP43_03030 [bacterium]|nr:hypothetical protein [bacterium]